MRYAAFLRGINVGGNKIIKMDVLRKAMESLGFSNVKTVLASGNVVFDSRNKPIALKITEGLKKKLGVEVGIQVRSLSELEKMIDSEPFAKIKVTAETRLYVTFVPQGTNGGLKIPYSSDDNNFRILSRTDHELFSVAIITKDRTTVDLMGIIDKTYGKQVTTRNWNTIHKLIKA